MRLHHATVKKAKELGIVLGLTEDKSAIVATVGKQEVARGEDVKAVIEQAQEAAAAFQAEMNAKSRSIVKRTYKQAYRPHHGSCGDDLAAEMKAFLTKISDETGEPFVDLALLKRFAEANDCWIPAYRSLNPGQQRMNVGNRLRAKVRKDPKFAINWVA